MDTTPSEHFYIYGLMSNFFIYVNFRASIMYVLVSGIVRPLMALCTSFIVVFLAILPCFLFQTNWKHIFWRSFTKLSWGLDSKMHKWISFDRISDFSTAALPSGVIVLSDQILNLFKFIFNNFVKIVIVVYCCMHF